MAEPTGNERGHDAGELAAAARDRGMEQLETAKAQLADEAERVAAAVERTADELEGDGDEGISGFGHSAASLMRQLAGGLRERDVEEFAGELGALARRNPGVFLAGSVALGFGIARFFKARAPRGQADRDYSSRETGEWQAAPRPSSSEGDDYDAEESLDLSANSERRRNAGESAATAADSERGETVGRGEDERSRGKARQGGKQRAKPQRASAGGAEPRSSDARTPATERPPTGAAGPADSALTGGTGSGTLRGDKP